MTHYELCAWARISSYERWQRLPKWRRVLVGWLV